MTLVCRPTPIGRVHAHERAMLKATHALHGTIRSRGSVFTHDPLSWNPPEHYSVSNVQKNSLSILLGRTKVEMVLPAGSAAYIPWALRPGPYAAIW